MTAPTGNRPSTATTKAVAPRTQAKAGPSVLECYSPPRSLTLSLQDPPMREATNDRGMTILVPATWTPPEHRLLPEILEKGLRHIEKFLEPGTDSDLAAAIMPMLLSLKFETKPEFLTDASEKAFYGKIVGDMIRHFRGTPADIMRDACDAHVKASSFFPTVAELYKHVTPALEKRRSDLARTKRIIEWQNAPAKAKAFQPEPREVRLRASIERWRKYQGHFMAATLRESANMAEIELAEIEGRAPEPWAVEQSTKPQPQRQAPPPKPPPATIDGTWSHVEAPEIEP